MLDINNSVAVITGGGGGIGFAVAKHWVENGGKVLLADVAQEPLDKAAAEITAMNGEVATIVCDVTNENDCGAMADLAIERFGAINLVAPFAGITKDELLLHNNRETGKVDKKMPLHDFQKVIDIDLTGVFLTVRECGERMINNDCKGLICLVSSTGSLGTAGQINYCSSKAAMSVMPKVITAEFFRHHLADKIRCVAVAPGYVATHMVTSMDQHALEHILQDVPIGRLIEPAEIAQLVGDIYRNEAIAGEVFYIHGGLRLGSRG